MKRYPPLSKEFILRRLSVDTMAGKCQWIDPTKYHLNLAGEEAGHPRRSCEGKQPYWVISLDGVQYKRAYIVYLCAHGRWPLLIDHINGNALDDRISNLREATLAQNSWNHRGRRKKSSTPMGVRITASGRFQARIACNKIMLHLGVFDTAEDAYAVYRAKRQELFGEYCGL